jgi:hypothetical protein
MNVRLIAGAFGIMIALAACGGGGGGGGTTPPANQATTGSTPTATPPTTNASGTVVDDGSGAPLAGVAVKLMPWAPCGPTPSPATSITPESDGCPTPLPSPQVTTAANGTFTLSGIPNGHYLLIIGADAVATVPPGYTTPPGNCSPNPCASPSPVPGTAMQATVHDNVTLTGGNQALVAPTLPAVPSGYTAPTWETNGDYRLATLNASTEMPCLIAWQYERAQYSLAGASVDEWLLENVRANLAYVTANGGGNASLLTTGNVSNSGGTSCASQITSSFAVGIDAYATNPRALWFGGQYLPYGGGAVSAFGLAEFPIDPRSFADPNHPNWP